MEWFLARENVQDHHLGRKIRGCMYDGCSLGTDRLRRRQPQRRAGLHECRRQPSIAAPICSQLLLLLLKLELLLLRLLKLLLLLELLHLHGRLVWLRHARE